MADSITKDKHYEFARDRAYLLWKIFSAYVHFSKWSFESENNPSYFEINQYEEALQYVYNSIYFCSEYFANRELLNLKRSKYIDKVVKFGLIKKQI